MDLVILIRVQVQANEFTSIFFHPSSLAISFPPLELDNNYATIYSCLEEEFASCEEKQKEGYHELFATCIFHSYVICTFNKSLDDPIFEIIKLGFTHCVKKHYILILQNVSTNGIKK